MVIVKRDVLENKEKKGRRPGTPVSGSR